MQASNTQNISKDGKISPKMGPVAKKTSMGVTQSKIPKISADNYNKYSHQTSQNNSQMEERKNLHHGTHGSGSKKV